MLCHLYCVMTLGAVILGSVDGNRIWGKELKNVQLSHVEVTCICIFSFDQQLGSSYKM